jgi:hypothetical protein
MIDINVFKPITPESDRHYPGSGDALNKTANPYEITSLNTTFSLEIKNNATSDEIIDAFRKNSFGKNIQGIFEKECSTVSIRKMLGQLKSYVGPALAGKILDAVTEGVQPKCISFFAIPTSNSGGKNSKTSKGKPSVKTPEDVIKEQKAELFEMLLTEIPAPGLIAKTIMQVPQPNQYNSESAFSNPQGGVRPTLRTKLIGRLVELSAIEVLQELHLFYKIGEKDLNAEFTKDCARLLTENSTVLTSYDRTDLAGC